MLTKLWTQLYTFNTIPSIKLDIKLSMNISVAQKEVSSYFPKDSSSYSFKNTSIAVKLDR